MLWSSSAVGAAPMARVAKPGNRSGNLVCKLVLIKVCSDLQVKPAEQCPHPRFFNQPTWLPQHLSCLLSFNEPARMLRGAQVLVHSTHSVCCRRMGQRAQISFSLICFSLTVRFSHTWVGFVVRRCFAPPSRALRPERCNKTRAQRSTD